MSKQPPVEKNQYYIMDIDDLGHKGEGIGKIKGFTVFVPRGLPGDKIEVKVVKVKKNYAYGRLIKIIQPSQHRVQELCPVAGRCGGCQIQSMKYKSQLDFKTKIVKDNIERIGGLKDVKIHNCIGMDNPWRYRNKAQFPVGTGKDGKIAIGFYAPRSHDIIDNPVCHIQHVFADKVIEVVKKFMEDNRIPSYDEITGRGLIRHIVTRIGFETDEAMVVIVTNGTQLSRKDDLISRLITEVPAIKSIVQNINTRNTNVIMGEKNITLYGQSYITDYIGELKFKISSNSFFQVNPIQTEYLYNKAVEYAGLSDKEVVFDLYCGTGTISLFMASKAQKVYGVEVVAQAIEDARNNAAENEIKNVEFIEGEAEKIVPELYRKGITADVIVLDPPRKGCDESLLETIKQVRPQRIVYVSCNPSTLARDLSILEKGGYKTIEIQPVDMFPHTVHIETVCLLSSKIKGFG